MSKVLIIQQAFGLGDIVFTQTIANDFIKDGYRILWPCIPSLEEDLTRAYPNIKFVDHTLLPINLDNKNYYEKDGFTYLPMRYSEWLMKREYRFHMKSKYDYLNKDWRRWKEHAMPVRNPWKEMGLEKELGIDGPYNLISTTFGSNGEFSVDISVGNNYKNIELKYIPGYSLFDWCSIIEKAETIHAVSSSSLYLFEILNLKASEVHLYCRKPREKNFEYVEFLFTKNYILHQ